MTTTIVGPQLPVVKTANDLSAMFAAYCRGPQGEYETSDGNIVKVQDIPVCRSSKLTAEQIEVLNQYMVDHCRQFLVDPNGDNILETLLGLKVAGPNDEVFCTVGSVSYTATNNQENRNITESRVGPVTKLDTYSNLQMRGLWALLFTDSYTYDWARQIQTAQHRLKAMLLSRAKGTKLPLIHVTVGVPPHLRDFMDKAKAASKKDDDVKDKSILPRDTVSLLQLHETGIVTELQNWKSERAKLIELRNKASGSIDARFSGKDYTTSARKDWSADKVEDFTLRFGHVDVDSFERFVKDPVSGVETVDSVVDGCEALAFDKLLIKVQEASKMQNGKKLAPWTDLFCPPIVLTGLVLASNDEEYLNSQIDTIRRPGETVEEYNDRLISAESSLKSPDSDIRIDWVLVDQVLQLLKTSMPGGGQLGVMMQGLVDDINSGKDTSKVKAGSDAVKKSTKYVYAANSIASMSAFVQLVKNIRSEDYESKIFTKYKPDANGDYPSSFRCFGGMDIGFQVVSKKSKD